jgi:integrase
MEKEKKNLFTDRYIQSLKATEDQIKPRDIRENSGKGFAITVFPSSEKSFVYIYHFGGRKRRMTLGKYPQMSLANAKKEHRKALKILLEDKKDPALEAKQKKMEEQGASTIAGLIKEYLDTYAKPNKRSWKEDERMLHKDVLSIWGKRKAYDITRREVIQLLDKIKERGSPIIANRTLACIRRMFNFAIKRALLDSSPCVMIEAPAKENRRDRYLSEDEIKIFWHGLNNAPMTLSIKLALKFLLITAQRKSEVITAEWSEIDFNSKIWTIPAEKSKNKISHRVPLSTLALEILEQVKEISGASHLLFPSEKSSAPIRGQSVDHALRRSMHLFHNMNHFCVHDCRRTAATHMASLRIPGEILSRVLNHAKRGVTEQHYIKHGYDDEKRNALEIWSQKLRNIVNNAENPSNTTSLKSAV